MRIGHEAREALAQQVLSAGLSKGTHRAVAAEIRPRL